MSMSDTNFKTRFKVGLFTVVGLFSVGALTVYVNDRPYWYRPCQLVHISVDDATGLKTKSPIRSMGLEIGYLKSVELSESHVRLAICITAPVEVLPSTRAYMRGEGFLGDKFVELKPVKYLGTVEDGEKTEEAEKQSMGEIEIQQSVRLLETAGSAVSALIFGAEAFAADPAPAASPAPAAEPAQPARRQGRGREIPVGSGSQDMQAVIGKVDGLVSEMTNLTTNLKQAIRPEELRETMRQLNKTLENASKTISPEGSLNQTAQRALAKLEDAIEQMRQVMVRINKGEGSVGMLLNDPSYAQEVREALKNLNKLLGKVSDIRFVVDIGGQAIKGYDGGRGWFRVSIWPKRDRYYLLGVSVDPRGRRTKLKTTTEVTGGPTTEITTTQLEETGLLVTAMFGKVFWNFLDLSIGALNGDGAVSLGLNLGPSENREFLQVRQDVFMRGGDNKADGRLTFTVRPWLSTYLNAGLDSYSKVGGRIPWFYGAGVAFDDEDIKLLFALR